jgi:hypothetical protein
MSDDFDEVWRSQVFRLLNEIRAELALNRQPMEALTQALAKATLDLRRLGGQKQ